MGEVKMQKRMHTTYAAFYQQGKKTKKLHNCLRRNYNISHFYGVLYVVDSFTIIASVLFSLFFHSTLVLELFSDATIKQTTIPKMHALFRLFGIPNS